MDVMEPSAPSPPPVPQRQSKPRSKKKPSKDQQIIDLAGRMISELRTIKTGGGPFPLTVRDLAARCGASDETLIKKSLGKKDFTAYAVTMISARSKHKARRLDAFVCLKEDVPRLAASDELLALVFELGCSGNQRLFSASELAKQLPETADLRKSFKQTLDARVKDDSLPDSVGYLPKDGRTSYLFRLTDIRPVRPTKTTSVPTASESLAASVARDTKPSLEPSPRAGLENDFADRFEMAFARLNREAGSHNFVKISELRRALSEFDRISFDRGVWQLRKERKFTANSSDGNYEQVSPEDRSAGIREGDSLLIYISRL